MITTYHLLKWLGYAMALLLALFIAFVMFLTLGLTHFRETDRVSNPSKTIDAAILRTSGGGALGWSNTNVFVMGPSETPEEYKSRGSLYFKINGPQKLSLSWIDDRQLLVRLICEEFPGKPETDHLNFRDEDVAVAIQYVDCDDVDGLARK